MTSDTYRRTSLPGSARTPVGWLALCFAGLIFSPFVGFAIHGTVDEAGLIIGLKFAVLPLLGLAAIAMLRWLAWRALPPEVADEWRRGKVVPAAGARAVVPPVRFSDGEHWISMSASALTASRSALLSLQGLPQTMSSAVASAASGEMTIRWADIIEWTIETDSDGPDYQVLRLRAGGAVRLRRFAPTDARESDLLDAVRSVGGVPIRLLDDVEGAT